MSHDLHSFTDALEDVSRRNAKIPQSAFLNAGSLAIVDQGQRLVAGYTDQPSLRCKVNGPVIIFGDHTRIFKYVDFPFAMGADGVKVLQVRAGWEAKYVFHYLQWKGVASAGYSRHFKFLREVRIPRPSVDEQRHIVAVLDQAEALRARRSRVLADLHQLPQAFYRDLFGDQVTTPLRSLGDLAHITSGITKGRRTTSDALADVPYLSVANVQDGHLKLDLVKTIAATSDEIARFALRREDLLLTEGGDPDKLGRGTVWRGELPIALHQNHIFRVRLRCDTELLVDYLSAFIAGRAARAYFLRSAKQTTGIASINMSQLKALPVRVPLLADQRRYVGLLSAIGQQEVHCRAHLDKSNQLMSSLQQLAFAAHL